jgi:protein-tyrosine phosphatase
MQNVFGPGGTPAIQVAAPEIPMRQISPHLLWLGHAGDGRDYRRILDAEIQAVVQLAAEEPTLESPRDLIYCRFPLVDGPGNDRKLLQLAITTVVNLLEMKVPTLLFCGAGLSRSPTIAAAALALVYQDSPDECLKQVTEHFPADVALSLWNDIKMIVEEQVER